MTQKWGNRKNVIQWNFFSQLWLPFALNLSTPCFITVENPCSDFKLLIKYNHFLPYLLTCDSVICVVLEIISLPPKLRSEEYSENFRHAVGVAGILCLNPLLRKECSFLLLFFCFFSNSWRWPPKLGISWLVRPEFYSFSSVSFVIQELLARGLHQQCRNSTGTPRFEP